MNPSLSIRPATPADIAPALNIYNDAILNTTAVYTYDPFTPAMMEQWFNDKKEKSLPIFIAEIDSTVAGFATYGPFRPWPAYRHTVEHSIYVHKGFRRQGIARRLLNELIESAKQQGMHTMVAGIDSENDGSILLHRQAGFSETSQLLQVGYKFDRWLNLQFMQLLLNSTTHEK
ncbi:MAG: N-acetyltransferase [Bacteroidetes bacterium]|nr:N-acetyltransferase [Bacteroidota bacterium]